ncbi:hypothetical protein J4219_07845 [Candidatus Woesearchaeota archaeon]|nr:hypothetical protein [Candidatus Woesearchaeota archaeon]
MSDERLRAQLRKAKETGEWMPYLVAVQRTGVSIEEALKESGGAAIPLIRDNPEILYVLNCKVHEQAMDWMGKAAKLPSESAIICATYAALGMEDAANNFLIIIPDEFQQQARNQMAIDAEQNNHQEFANRIPGQTDSTFELRAHAAAENRNYLRAKQLIRLCRPSPSLLMSLARIAAENTDYDQAESFAANVNPLEQAYLELTEIASSNGDLETTLAFSEKTSHLIRKARMQIAAVYAHHQEYQTAQAFAQNSSNPDEAHMRMAQACASKKDYKKAGRLVNKIKQAEFILTACHKIAVLAAQNKDYDQTHIFLPSLREDPTLFEMTLCAISNEAAKNKDYAKIPFFCPRPGTNRTLTLGCIANAQLRNGDISIALHTVESMQNPQAQSTSYCDFARELKGAR